MASDETVSSVLYRIQLNNEDEYNLVDVQGLQSQSPARQIESEDVVNLHLVFLVPMNMQDITTC